MNRRNLFQSFFGSILGFFGIDKEPFAWVASINYVKPDGSECEPAIIIAQCGISYWAFGKTKAVDAKVDAKEYVESYKAHMVSIWDSYDNRDWKLGKTEIFPLYR